MASLGQSWVVWAGLAAVFAALTAVFAKAGVTHINADYATFLRTLVVIVVLGAILTATGKFEPLTDVSGRGMLFLVLSGCATGASWLCYFRALKLGQASQVAPVDKLSVVLVAVFGVLFLGEHLTGTAWAGVALIAVGAVLVAVG
jgi:transporter family protein